MKTGTLCLLGLLAACGSDEASGEPNIDEEVEAFVKESNEEAREVCNVPTDARVEDLESGDSESAACYNDLAYELDDCERAAMREHPEEARRLLDCSKINQDKLIDCCETDGACDYAKLEACEDEQDACEDVDWDKLEAAIDRC